MSVDLYIQGFLKTLNTHIKSILFYSVTKW